MRKWKKSLSPVEKPLQRLHSPQINSTIRRRPRSWLKYLRPTSVMRHKAGSGVATRAFRKIRRLRDHDLPVYSRHLLRVSIADLVLACSNPGISVRSWTHSFIIRMASSCQPISYQVSARLCIFINVSGWSTPITLRLRSNRRASNSSASANRPCSQYSAATLNKLFSVSGCSGLSTLELISTARISAKTVAAAVVPYTPYGKHEISTARPLMLPRMCIHCGHSRAAKETDKSSLP